MVPLWELNHYTNSILELFEGSLKILVDLLDMGLIKSASIPNIGEWGEVLSSMPIRVFVDITMFLGEARM